MKKITLIFMSLICLNIATFARGNNSGAGSSETENDLEVFTTLEDAQLRAESKPVVLFFHATWCPSCRAAKENIISNSDLVDGIDILVVDYDSNNDLILQYGVSYQHTFVQIDSSGERVALWNGGGAQEIADNVKGF